MYTRAHCAPRIVSRAKNSLRERAAERIMMGCLLAVRVMQKRPAQISAGNMTRWIPIYTRWCFTKSANIAGCIEIIRNNSYTSHRPKNSRSQLARYQNRLCKYRYVNICNRLFVIHSFPHRLLWPRLISRFAYVYRKTHVIGVFYVIINQAIAQRHSKQGPTVTQRKLFIYEKLGKTDK